MAGLNKVMIIGNLGRDPEMRFTANGSAVTNFTVAVSRQYSSADGERREETEWVRVVTWNKLAEQCNQFLQKGRRVYVEGRLQTRSWDGQDGQKRYSTEVVAQDVQFLDRAGGAAAVAGGGRDSMLDGDISDPDDLPFE